ncbi:helix-turn-helix domain-containing protein [uncultured Acinetobacter sp.]|uniref:helix-turn-helix domain-containing protein n=1 Tax=uncultured Acinetobacter sp. TaxID=165433 RepID=UPI0025F31624|nr:helix-turn-helix domain-containing protein [uncultured Acinetobacter sp.]
MEVNPNSQQPTGSNVASNGLGNVQRPGEYLRQVRVSKNLDINDVAAELKMPVKTLQALEHDEYKSLPEATFIKGYYRSYAKYLNVDATAIIQRFDEIYQNDTGLLPNHALNNSPIKIMGKLPGSNRDRNKKWLKRIFIALIAIAVIWALIAGIQKWTSNKNVDADAKPQESDVEVLNLNNSASTSGDQMVLNFSHPTSVHIVDSTGKVLATGRQSSTLNISGTSPFEIRLDDATAVSLSLNNEQISLSPYTVNGKAEFRLSR